MVLTGAGKQNRAWLSIDICVCPICCVWGRLMRTSGCCLAVYRASALSSQGYGAAASWVNTVDSSRDTEREPLYGQWASEKTLQQEDPVQNWSLGPRDYVTTTLCESAALWTVGNSPYQAGGCKDHATLPDSHLQDQYYSHQLPFSHENSISALKPLPGEIGCALASFYQLDPG